MNRNFFQNLETGFPRYREITKTNESQEMETEVDRVDATRSGSSKELDKDVVICSPARPIFQMEIQGWRT